MGGYFDKQIEDYNTRRTRRGYLPISFKIIAIEIVDNPILKQKYQNLKQTIWEKLKKNDDLPADSLFERWGFHATKAENLHGLLRLGPLPINSKLLDSSVVKRLMLSEMAGGTWSVPRSEAFVCLFMQGGEELFRVTFVA